KSRLEGSQLQNELQILRDDNQDAEADEEIERVDGERHGYRGAPEEAEIEKRVAQCALPAQEPRAERNPDDRGQARREWTSALRYELDAVDDRQHRNDRQNGADEVEPSGVGVLVFGQQKRPGDQQQRHDGYGSEEDSTPPKAGQDHSADGGPDHPAQRKARYPDTYREGFLLSVAEHVADERECRWRHGRARDPEQCASGDEHTGCPRKSGDHGQARKTRRPDEQQLATPDPIAQRPHDE